MARVLLAGESWSTTSTHTKGFDSFITSAYAEGAGPFIEALELVGHEVTFMPNHKAMEHFPMTIQELENFDVVVLSDIGSNTLLLSTNTFVRGKMQSNRLQVLSEWVTAGGSLLMVGGYLSFQGIEGKANYRNTSLASVLPIVMEQGDDRNETPEGAFAKVISNHEVVKNLKMDWPAILGYQRIQAKAEAETLIEVNGDPLLVLGTYGSGKVAAFASDMGPHWLPNEFLAWDGFKTLWQQLIEWLS